MRTWPGFRALIPTLAAALVGAIVTVQEPVRIGGVALGDSAARVRAALGEPDRRDSSLGLGFWDYDRRGVSVIWDRDSGTVRGVVLHKAEAGRVEGVRVGESADRARARWGPATRVRQGGRFLDFVRAGWIHSAELRGGRVMEITVFAK